MIAKLLDQKGNRPRFSSEAIAVIDRMIRPQCKEIQDFVRVQEEGAIFLTLNMCKGRESG
ncbi:MAG: hypothetical protein OXC30_03105 [Alphaproteobacteria bacterium]|nr:hypothetical protein [Alphaproteobacteria bacterium]